MGGPASACRLAHCYLPNPVAMSSSLQASALHHAKPSAALKPAPPSPSRPAEAYTLIVRLIQPQTISGPRSKPPGLAVAVGTASSGAGWGRMSRPRQRRLVPQSHAQQQGQAWVQQVHHHPLLETLNDATKWAVSCVAFGTLLWRRDLLAAWCVLGSVVAAVNCRVSGLGHSANQHAGASDSPVGTCVGLACKGCAAPAPGA